MAYKINIAEKEYLEKTGEEIGILELAKVLKTSKEEIAFAIEAAKELTSLYQDEGEDSGKNALINTISTNKDEEKFITDKLTIKQLIEELETKEKEIILLRYFKEKTQVQVAKILRHISSAGI